MASGDDRQFWKVVGGEKTGGIIVRSDSTYTSEVLTQRLSTGAVINGLELDESLTRLRYELVAGDGPSEGWVTLKIKDKELLVPCDDDPVEDLRYERRKQAETVPVARPVKQAETVPVARPVKEPEISPPARRTPPADPQGSKKMFAWKNPNRDRNKPSTATAPEPTPSPAPKPTPSVPAEKPSAYPEYPKLDKSNAIEKIGRPKPTPPPSVVAEPQIVHNPELPTSSLMLPSNVKIEDVVDQMYQLRPGKAAAWHVAKTEQKKGNHTGVPIPLCVLPCNAPDSAVPPGKRLVNIDFRAKKGQRLWMGDEMARQQGEAMLNRVGPMYGVKYSWDSRCSSAFDSLRLVLWAQSQGKNEEFMGAIGWRHFGEDKQLSDRQVLLAAVEEAGLDRHQAEQMLDRGGFQKELAETSAYWLTKTMVDAGNGMMVSGIPVLIFKSTNPKQKGEEKLHGSIPQHDIEAALRKLEALE